MKYCKHDTIKVSRLVCFLVAKVSGFSLDADRFGTPAGWFETYSCIYVMYIHVTCRPADAVGPVQILLAL